MTLRGRQALDAAAAAVGGAKRKRGAMRERAVQASIVEALKLLGGPGLLWFAVPNEGRRKPGEGAAMKAAGVTPGVFDLVITWPAGRVVQALGVEVKDDGGALSEHQKRWAALSQECGWLTLVARSAGDVLDALAPMARPCADLRKKMGGHRVPPAAALRSKPKR